MVLTAAGIVNAAFIFLTFVLTLPGIITPTRGWLKLAGFLVVFCALFTLCIGVFLWILTLRMQDRFLNIWIDQNDAIRSLMQTSVRFRPDRALVCIQRLTEPFPSF